MNGLDEDKLELLRFLHEVQAFQFGEFTLKSGRVSPYFFNSACFDTGSTLRRLAGYYAAAIARHAPDADIVFGPAYKGIPLCVSVAIVLSRQSGRDVGYLFNRKEEKGHGDRGLLVGREPLAGQRLVLVDDVITDGGTKLEAVAMLRKAHDAAIDALVIAFNRMETDAGGEDAVVRFESATGIPVVSLLTVADLETALASGHCWHGPAGEALPAVLDRIRAYRRRYGVPST